MKILLVDDDVFNREGIRLYLQSKGAEVVEAGDEATAWSLTESAAPDVAVLDISIPPSPDSTLRSSQSLGVQLANRIKRAHPDLGVVLFSAYEDRGSEVLEMIREGVRGIAYKLKGCPPSALLSAIHDVMAGRVVIDPEVHANQRGLAEELLKRLTAEERVWVETAVKEFNGLTPREQEIAHRLAASHNTEGIAQALSLSPKTAENYIGHVYDKLGLNEMGKQAPNLRKVVVLAKACMIFDLSH
ncbi:MAG: response regulator transcription factor [Chloroflexi bacterium]|nr:response regulator transcription factor [Chloroflexota bacterium]MBI5714468.1 response regulator transcription factor [Chloroflexota bacterium]